MPRHAKPRPRRGLFTPATFVVAAAALLIGVAWMTRAGPHAPATTLPDGSPTSSASAAPATSTTSTTTTTTATTASATSAAALAATYAANAAAARVAHSANANAAADASLTNSGSTAQAPTTAAPTSATTPATTTTIAPTTSTSAPTIATGTPVSAPGATSTSTATTVANSVLTAANAIAAATADATLTPTIAANGVAPANALVAAAIDAAYPGAGLVCFTISSTSRCGQTSSQQQGTLPSSLGQAMVECNAGTLRSPIGCALASGRVPLNTPAGTALPGHYWAWIATGDLFSCPLSAAPTLGAGCTFQYNTVGSSWGLPQQNCPAAMNGIVNLNGRVEVTIGIGSPSGYRAEPAMIDTGAVYSYILESQLQGTSATPNGVLTALLFPLLGQTVGSRIWNAPLAVLDGQRWVPLGTVPVDGLSTGVGVGDGLGTNAMTNMTLDTNGGAFSLQFACA